MSRTTSPERYLTIAEAAGILNCNPITVRRMIARGGLHAYRFPGARMVRIDPADLARIRRPVTRITDQLGGDAA